MLSGQLTPSSADYVQHPLYNNEDDIDAPYRSGRTCASSSLSWSISNRVNNKNDNYNNTTNPYQKQISASLPYSSGGSTAIEEKRSEPSEEGELFIPKEDYLSSIDSNPPLNRGNEFITEELSTGCKSETCPSITATRNNNNNNNENNSSLNIDSFLSSPLRAATVAVPNIATIIPSGATVTAAAAAAAASASSSNEASGRSAALERAYVHDVYENCDEPSGPIRPRVAQFLAGLDPGSIVCDVGCGNGRYLTSCNPLICTVGVDRCYRLTKVAREKGGEVALCDNLELPFRDESFDAVLSLAVVHHFATTERRVGAIRELARILRIGGRVVITVWALEQKHRRFESQDVLIPWQPPKNRNFNYSDDEDDDEYLPPYHAYTEDSTNSSRSAGDGDSSSLSSSSPGESCYSFVRKAIQKLAGGRKHPWFLDSWTSKETKNDSSIEYEDAKDLPIELRRLEDFEDYPDPPLSAGLKSRSLGSILNPPPRQIVRSQSSVPSLGGVVAQQSQQCSSFPASSGISPSIVTATNFEPSFDGTITTSPQRNHHCYTTSALSSNNGYNINSGTITTATVTGENSLASTVTTSGGALFEERRNDADYPNSESPVENRSSNTSIGNVSGNNSGRRPRLVKQKQSLCDDEHQLPYNSVNMTGNNSANSKYNNNNSNINVNNEIISNNSNSNSSSGCNVCNNNNNWSGSGTNICCTTSAKNIININGKTYDTKLFLRKQSSLNEELMAESRLREKERVRKRIQKQVSLNEAFLCRSSIITKRLQVIREGFTTKFKTSTGSLERVTKNGLVKIMQNFKSSQFAAGQQQGNNTDVGAGISGTGKCTLTSGNYAKQQNQKFFHSQSKNSSSCSSSNGSNQNCQNSNGGKNNSNSNNGNNNNDCSNSNLSNGNEDQKARRHSRESGSDSSKDSSLQSDTSIESEDSFASVIYIPKPEQQQQQNNSSINNNNNNNNNNGSTISNNNNNSHHCHQRCKTNGGNFYSNSNNCGNEHNKCGNNNTTYRIPSVPTSPLIMPCPPTPAHSPAAVTSMLTISSSPVLSFHSTTTGSTTAIPSSSCRIISSSSLQGNNAATTTVSNSHNDHSQNTPKDIIIPNGRTQIINCFTFDEEHINQQMNKPISPPLVPILPETSDRPSYVLPQKQRNSPAHKIGQHLGSSVSNMGKVTRQSIKDLPPIPKFRKQQSLQQQPTTKISFPIVRRSSAAPAVPKLLSLELFNPETDDLDSDSSEPSSPDSIDSVINALKPGDNQLSDKIVSSSRDNINSFSGNESLFTTQAGIVTTATNTDSKILFSSYASENANFSMAENQNPLSADSYYQRSSKSEALTTLVTATTTMTTAAEATFEQSNTFGYPINDPPENELFRTTVSDLKNLHKNDSYSSIYNNYSNTSSGQVSTKQDFIDFAKELSSQLLKEIEETKRSTDKEYYHHHHRKYSHNMDEDYNENIDNPFIRRKSDDECSSISSKDVTSLRKELRERRLLLANLMTPQNSNQHQQLPPPQSPTLTSSSTSSFSSQSRSFVIHEEDEEALIKEDDEDDDMNSRFIGNEEIYPSIFDNKKFKTKYFRNLPSNMNNYHLPKFNYFLNRNNDDHDDIDRLINQDDDEDNEIEHDVIIEEDEEENDELNNRPDNEDDEDDDDYDVAEMTEYSKRTSSNTIKCTDCDDCNIDNDEDPPLTTVGNKSMNTILKSSPKNPEANNNNENNRSANSSNNNKSFNGKKANENSTKINNNIRKRVTDDKLNIHESTESWGHSNSTTSLDSPSQGGGSTTHHRYYHVFREGELDALINHHVASLHIVSSYYERASWCVVAEKVQVWTI